MIFPLINPFWAIDNFMALWAKEGGAMSEPYLRKGYIVPGPDGQAYEILEDVFKGYLVKASQFKALGGAPEPKDNTEMPDWLAKVVCPL